MSTPTADVPSVRALLSGGVPHARGGSHQPDRRRHGPRRMATPGAHLCAWGRAGRKMRCGLSADVRVGTLGEMWSHLAVLVYCQ